MRRQLQLFSVFITVSLFIFLSACSVAGKEASLATVEPVLSSSLQKPQAIYFALGTEIDPLQGEPIPDNILVVKTTEELMSVLKNLPETKVLFLEPDSLETIDSALLQDYYNKGVMVIALNTPIRKLGSKLGVYTEMEDLDMGDTPSGFTVFSAHQLVRGTEQDTSHAWMLSDYFASFADALSALTASADFNAE